MDPQKLIKYCPSCKKEIALENEVRFKCKYCGYLQYISPVPCNSLVISNKNGEILLVERKNEPKAGFWDLPGGFIDIGENIETSVIREAKEEVDLDFQVSDLHYISSIPLRYLYKGVNEYLLNVAYHADFPEGQKVTAGDDAKSAKFFAPEDIPWKDIAFENVTMMLRKYLNEYRN